MLTGSKSRILPIATPFITSYTNIASTFSIIGVQEEQIIPWISDHLIQLVGREEEGKMIDQWATFYDFATKDAIPAYEGIPFISKCKFDRVALEISDFALFIEEQINAGYYVHAYLDRYYLKVSNDYLKEHYNHQTFIYGYDRSKNEIYIADFYNQKFDFVSVSYQDINLSYNTDISIKEEYINFWKNHIYTSKQLDYKYEINIDLLKLSLKDYIDRKDSFLKYEYTFTHRNVKTFFGLDFYNVLKIHCNKHTEFIDYRAFHILCDHKKAMKTRFDYLNNNNFINKSMTYKLNIDIEDLFGETIRLRNMVLKYNIQSDARLHARIINNIAILENLDFRVSNELLNALVV